MLKADVIKPPISEYNAPIVIVRKKDGSNRSCIDFRRLNAVIKFDTEPMASVDDIMAKLTNDKSFTKTCIKGIGKFQLLKIADCYCIFNRQWTLPI